MDKTNDNSIVNEQKNTQNDFSAQLKDKLFNKVYFYIIVSFMVFNWQEIIILFKAKEDIYYTLAMIFTGNTLFGEFFLPAWFAHFGLPILTGLLASVLTPYITFLVFSLTSGCFAKIRYVDRAADLKLQGELAKAKEALTKQEEKNSSLEKRNMDLKRDNENLASKNTSLLEQRRQLFFGIKAFVDCYDEKKGLRSEKDVIDFLKEVEHTDFYRDQVIIKKIPKLIDDLKIIYLEGEKPTEARIISHPVWIRLGLKWLRWLNSFKNYFSRK